MQLRHELRPPRLDDALVARLAALADRIDGSHRERAADAVTEFNRVAGTDVPFDHFQGIAGSEDHDDWVRRVLYYHLVRPVPDATREELVEVVRRAAPAGDYFDEHEGYMAVFDANVPLDGASLLLYYPVDLDPATNTWGDGRPLCDYDPSPEQIVDIALAGPRE